MGNGNRRQAIVPAFWVDFYEETHIPAATVAGGRVHVTGHTGTRDDGTFPDTVEEQLRLTFRNLSLTLAEAGARWDDAVALASYHVGLRVQSEVLLRVAAEFLRDPYPSWTAAGVTELFEPEALVEISCVAVLPE